MLRVQDALQKVEAGVARIFFSTDNDGLNKASSFSAADLASVSVSAISGRYLHTIVPLPCLSDFRLLLSKLSPNKRKSNQLDFRALSGDPDPLALSQQYDTYMTVRHYA